MKNITGTNKWVYKAYRLQINIQKLILFYILATDNQIEILKNEMGKCEMWNISYKYEKSSVRFTHWKIQNTVETKECLNRWKDILCSKEKTQYCW